jgi:phosphoserine phosphatase RsbU/P
MDQEIIRLLLIEDDAVDQIAFTRFVKKESLPYDYVLTSTIAEAKQILDSHVFDIILIDYDLGNGTAFDIMNIIHDDVPFIIITGTGDEEIAIEALKKGASDYIVKALDNSHLQKLPKTISKSIKAKQTARETQRDHKRLKKIEAQLGQEIDAYKNSLVSLNEQMDSAVNVYQDLVRIDTSGFKIKTAIKNRPLAKLGGDFADIRKTENGYDILIADVAGHDLGSSYHTILLKAFFEENCRKGNDGLTFFKLLNQQLLENGKNERMVTALFIRLDLLEMQGTIVFAGHPAPIFMGGKLPMPREINSITGTGDVLGIKEDVVFTENTFKIRQGNRLFFYTDGVTNASNYNPETFQRKQLTNIGLDEFLMKHISNQLEEMVEYTWQDILLFCNNNPRDDLMLIGIEI